MVSGKRLARPVRRRPAGPGIDKVLCSTDTSDTEPSVGYVVRAALTKLMNDPETIGSARASAARTLAEMDGMIGRHQTAPERNASIPVHALSRTDLERELTRLRRVCALSAAADKA